ncbi:KH domain-containing protein [Candidatus Saccharibacteria bacterium]|nr:MAG: KH domain-containing protein [Candidatus Saccharibacteria bacterium]
MSSIDQQFIEYIVKSLVGKPDAVSITRTIDEKGVLLELTVDPEDLGRVIGKRGSTAQSLRALLRALGTKNDARYNLKIVDVDRPEGERNLSADTPSDLTPSDDSVTDDDMQDVSIASDDDSDEDVQNSTDEPVEKESNLRSKTRKELAELDDLDI